MDINIKINCHSSICINDVFYIDPFDIKKGNNNARIVFITHSHYDHFDLSLIEAVANTDTLFVAPEDVLVKLPSKYKNRKVAKIDESADGTGISYKSFPAYNINKPFHPRENKWVGYLLEIDGIKYAVCGDTDAISELLSLKCDVLLIPVGGTYTMNPEEAAKVTNIIRPKMVIPTHYGSVVGTLADGINFSKLIDKNIECKLLIK